MNTRAYRAISKQAQAIGWPQHWQTDLTVHDREELCRKNAPAVFVWSVRPTGTDLFYPGAWSDPDQQIQWLRNGESIGFQPRRYFFWDGDHLVEVAYQTALDIVVSWSANSENVSDQDAA